MPRFAVIADNVVIFNRSAVMVPTAMSRAVQFEGLVVVRVTTHHNNHWRVAASDHDRLVVIFRLSTPNDGDRFVHMSSDRVPPDDTVGVG